MVGVKAKRLPCVSSCKISSLTARSLKKKERPDCPIGSSDVHILSRTLQLFQFLLIGAMEDGKREKVTDYLLSFIYLFI